jgi:hypothetical protein
VVNTEGGEARMHDQEFSNSEWTVHSDHDVPHAGCSICDAITATRPDNDPDGIALTEFRAETERIKNKHDERCLCRKGANPFLCTCGLTDEQVEAHQAHLRSQHKNAEMGVEHSTPERIDPTPEQEQRYFENIEKRHPALADAVGDPMPTTRESFEAVNDATWAAVDPTAMDEIAAELREAATAPGKSLLTLEALRNIQSDDAMRAEAAKRAHPAALKDSFGYMEDCDLCRIELHKLKVEKENARLTSPEALAAERERKHRDDDTREPIEATGPGDVPHLISDEELKAERDSWVKFPEELPPHVTVPAKPRASNVKGEPDYPEGMDQATLNEAINSKIEGWEPRGIEYDPADDVEVELPTIKNRSGGSSGLIFDPELAKMFGEATKGQTTSSMPTNAPENRPRIAELRSTLRYVTSMDRDDVLDIRNTALGFALAALVARGLRR